MELYDYLLTNVRIGVITSGDNEGKFYVDADARWMNPKTQRVARGEKATPIQIWSEDDQEMVDTVRSLFPKTGKDSEGNDWNGTGDIDPKEFNVLEAQKTLRNYMGEDWLLVDGCSRITLPMNGNFCMKYSRDMNGHKQGEWVCGVDGFVKVWNERTVLCRFYPDGSPRPGWGPVDRLAKEMRNFFSISAVLKENPELVDPRFKAPENDVIPSNSSTEETPKEER